MRPGNDEIADALERVADLLEAQGANPYRVRAYREGARTCRTLDRSCSAILEEQGAAGLAELPGIGKSLSAAITELCRTGRLGLLDRLEGQIAPEDLFTTVPGIGEELAHRIHSELGAETLEDLELAAHDGRLAEVGGFGPRRVRAVKDALAGILSRSARRRSLRLDRSREEEPAPDPSVEALLDVDAEYRRRAAAGELRKITPRRFNPARRAWLPILHTEREGFRFTALFSNTARAHQLGMTGDWVVLFCERDGRETRFTVVTEHRGPLAGKRVVRGRERESREWHARRTERGV